MIWGYHYFWKHPFVLVDVISPPNSLGEMIEIVCRSFSKYVDTPEKPKSRIFPTETYQQTIAVDVLGKVRKGHPGIGKG